MRAKAISLFASIAMLLAAGAPLSGCASSTTISSAPEGAELRIDGQPVGNTPVSFTEDNVWVWTEHQIMLARKGYQSYHGILQAQVSPVHLVVGIICFFPLLPLAFVGEYKPRHHFVLVRKTVTALSDDFRESASIDFAE